MERIAIRKGTLGDLESIAALLGEITDYHVDALPKFFRPDDGRGQAEWMLRQVADNSKSVLVVAEAREQVVGLVHFEEREAEPHPVIAPRRFLRVGTLVVAEGSRGHGIAKALMRCAHDWGAARGLSEVELNVYEFNKPAIGLYERLGYETRARRMVRGLAPVEIAGEDGELGGRRTDA